MSALIAVVAPYEDLLEVARLAIRDMKVDAEVVLGNLRDGVRAAQDCIRRGADLIISRGGTYKMIKQAVNVPVVEIKVSPYDILKQFRGLVGFKGRVGVAGYANVIHGCELIADVLELDLVKVVIDDEKSAEERIAAAAEKGVDVFIGDTIGTIGAAKLGLETRLIKSGQESVAEAIHEALRMLEAIRVEKAKTEEVKTIVDFVHDGIIAVNREGIVTICNRVSEKVLKKPRENVIGRKVDEVIPNTRLFEVMNTGVPQIGELQTIEDVTVVTNRVPIKVGSHVLGAVATFQDVTTLQHMERKVRQKLADRGLVASYTFDSILYKSPKMALVVRQAQKYAALDSNILILGETGTGKELFAQSIHNASARKKGPFVAVNCAALPQELLESELFGYAEGAFTGARRGGKLGLFELAHGGTVFLDEIAEMPLGLQSKLLRVLQERKVMRLGDDRVIPVDVRIICATNDELYDMVKQGKFREDLFYRISVLPLRIPPLRERKEDLDVLVPFFIRKHSRNTGKTIVGITDEAMGLMKRLEYPGNVRELEGIIERACALCEGNTIELQDIQLYANVEFKGNNQSAGEDRTIPSGWGKTLKEVEDMMIRRALEAHGGSISKAAKELGLNRTTLWRRLRQSSPENKHE